MGALLVGRICNLHGAGPIQRGAEKGRFEFGGSTVIVLFQKDAVRPDRALLATGTAADQETPVQCGAVIGHANPEVRQQPQQRKLLWLLRQKHL